MRRLGPIASLGLAVASLWLYAQEATPVTEAIRGSVVFLFGQFTDISGPKTGFGTAFFIELPDERLGPGKVFCYLVTNKHVIFPKKEDGTTAELTSLHMRINRRFAEDRVRADYVPVPLPSDSGKIRWYFHKDPSVDLAVLPVCLDQKEVDHGRIPVSIFVTDEILKTQQVNENDEIIFGTLFIQYKGIEKNYPLIRHGKISLLSEEKFPVSREDPSAKRDLYLIEATAFPGNSGSPVLLRLAGAREAPGGGIQLGGRYYLLGVLEVFFPQETEINIGATTTTVNLNSGIAGVIPAMQLKELLDQNDVRSLREAAIAEKTEPSPK